MLVLLLFPFSILSVVLCNDFNLITRRDMLTGQVYPDQIRAVTGESVYLQITTPVKDEYSCSYRSPGRAFDINVTDTSFISDKIIRWSEQICGIIIMNVSVGDSGPWRLTSSRSGDLTRGVCILVVEERNETYLPNNTISSLEAWTPERTRYCYVVRHLNSSDMFPLHNTCAIPDMNTGLDANGIWNVIAGVDGQTEELQFRLIVDTGVEELITEYVYDNGPSNHIHMICNVKRTNKKITFCRFLRINDNAGFNLEPGLGNPKYSYFGSGLSNGECGLRIWSPNIVDRDIWKCFIGMETENGLTSTIGAIIDASETRNTLVDIIANDVYGLVGNDVQLLCKTMRSIDYCWFTHPSGLRISVSDRSTTTAYAYSYYGAGLLLGDCGITLKTAKTNDSGLWQCNLAHVNGSGFESIAKLSVRISDTNLIAMRLENVARTDSQLTLECVTIQVGQPIKYCRFIMANGRAFSIHDNITTDNALEGNYIFSKDRRLANGYCSVTILRTSVDAHNGSWTCAGLLVGHSEESLAKFIVLIIDSAHSALTIGGIAFAALIMFTIFVLFGFFCYRKLFLRVEPSRQSPAASYIEEDSSM